MDTNSPAFIMRELVVINDLASRPTPPKPWPAFVGLMPGAATDPDEAIAFYNSAGILDGRIMRSGKVIEHQGVQCRVRAVLEERGYAKSKQLREFLSSVVNYPITIQDNGVVVASVSMATGIAALGEEELRRRRSFTFNMTVTLSQE